MNAPALVITGFVVVAREKSERGKLIDKVVSRKYLVRDAAEQHAKMKRAAGHDAWVRDVLGYES
jgi:hypothetical protein